jgi:nitroreductase/NAD-dependent dihydropyrimidine dehydrogenase PreA subunit
MAHLIADERKCRRDGICVAVCPAGIIELKEDKAVPTPIEGADELCINCGHCVAVCPYGAMSLTTMDPDDCPPVRREWALSPEQAEHFLRSRRSIRAYKEESVDRETLRKLIATARYAPSGHNMQPVKWLVIREATEVRRLAGLTAAWMGFLLKEKPEMAAAMGLGRIVRAWNDGRDTICRGAPHLVIAFGKASDGIASSSSMLALAYLELAAPSFGLGACWAGYLNLAAGQWPPLQEALALPEGEVPFGSMMVGRPRYRYQRFPLRNEPPITWK